jgi:hypothetical protein
LKNSQTLFGSKEINEEPGFLLMTRSRGNARRIDFLSGTSGNPGASYAVYEYRHENQPYQTKRYIIHFLTPNIDISNKT